MNLIESLVKNIEYNGKIYTPRLYLTAWDNWCVSYRNPVDIKDYICSVCVEPDNEPRNIEDTIGYLNEYIGNARTLDDAVIMINNYIKKNFINN